MILILQTEEKNSNILFNSEENLIARVYTYRNAGFQKLYCN